MTSSSPTDPLRLVILGLLALSLVALAGCLADTAEDTDLPWASNGSWEGIAPIAPSMRNRYD